MAFRIAIEILSEANDIPSIVTRGYNLSQFGAVAFLLNGISPKQIDAILDRVVPTISVNIPGVSYIDINNTDRMTHVLSSSRLIVVFSPPLYNLAVREQQMRSGLRVLFCSETHSQ